MDWDLGSGDCNVIKSNNNAVLNIKVQADNLVAATLDDKIRYTQLQSSEIAFVDSKSVELVFHDDCRQEGGVSIEGPPKGLAVLGDLTVAASAKEVCGFSLG